MEGKSVLLGRRPETRFGNNLEKQKRARRGRREAGPEGGNENAASHKNQKERVPGIKTFSHPEREKGPLRKGLKECAAMKDNGVWLSKLKRGNQFALLAPGEKLKGEEIIYRIKG